LTYKGTDYWVSAVYDLPALPESRQQFGANGATTGNNSSHNQQDSVGHG
jgi:hypothetical protein